MRVEVWVRDYCIFPCSRAGYPVSRAATIAAAAVRHSSSAVAETKHSGSQIGAAPNNVSLQEMCI